MEDVMTTIPYHFTDVKTLIHFCSTNKTLCSDKSFWINIFNQWGLPLPAILPVDVNDWINEFYAIYNTNKIINYLYLFKKDVELLNNPHLKSTGFATNYIFKNVRQNVQYFKDLLALCGIIGDLNRLRDDYDIISIDIRYNHIGFFAGTYHIVFKLHNPNALYSVSIHQKSNYELINSTKEEGFIKISKPQITLFLYNILRDHVV